MKIEIIKNGIYRHYKGKNYRVLDVVLHSETKQEMVLYECLYENAESSLWVRPLHMFLETITVEGATRPRFQYIGHIKGKNRF